MRRLLAVFLSVQLAVAPAAWAASAGDRSALRPPPGPQASTGQSPAAPAAQTPPAGQSQAGAAKEQDPPDAGLPVSLARIRKGLTSESTLKLDLPVRDDIPRYYMEVSATPDFNAFLEDFDLNFGPVPGAGMTHQEFMQMVTPKDVYSQAGFGGLEILTANLGFAAVMYLATKAFNAMREAKNERELQQIRDEIQRELAELQKANAAKKKSGGESHPPGSP
jgi:hypothetical protein